MVDKMIDDKSLNKILNIDSLTDAQKDAVVSDAPVLLSASAGSGKTLVLSTRVVYNILGKNYNPKRMLVVTFTRSAAAEMKDRIINLFNKAVLKGNINNFAYLKSQIDLMTVTTIDSFCANFLREHFESASVSPDFSICDENSAGKLKTDAIDELFEEEYKKAPKQFQKTVDYFSLKGDYKLKETVLTVYKSLINVPYGKNNISSLIRDYEHPPKLGDTSWVKEILKEIEEELKPIKEDMVGAETVFEIDPALEKSFKPVAETILSELNELLDKIQNRRFEEIKECVDKFEFPTFPRYSKIKNPFNKKLAELYKKAAVEPLKKKIKKIKSDYLISESDYKQDMKEQSEVIKKLAELAEGFERKYSAKKEEANVLDFDDLILKTIGLLSNSRSEKTELGKRIESVYDEILIDEYQDINETQDLLFSLLSKQNRNLFMVGDIKQSIYRFRGADANVFIKKREQFKADGKSKLINLTDNFRSRRQVTDSVNLVFKGLMSEDFGGVDYDDTQNLNSKAVFKGNSDYRTEVHYLDLKAKNDEATAFEADHIAFTIKKMIDSKFEVYENGEKRCCQPKDFAILLRSAQNSARIFKQRFKRAGLAVKQEGITGYFDSGEVSLIISLLKIVDNPLLDLPMLSVILSPLFDFTPNDAVKIRLTDAKAPLYKCILKRADRKCKKFVRYLNELRNAEKVMNISGLIQKIYDDTYYYALCGACETGEQKTANLRLLHSYASRYEQTSYGGLSGFLRMIDKMKSLNMDFESANTPGDSDLAVKIMTIHKSKGLEFPIVFLAKTGSKFNEREINDTALITKKYKLAMKHSNPEMLSRYPTIPYIASKIYEKRMLREEELRILYVALTRAKEKLIITTDKGLTYFTNRRLQPFPKNSVSSYDNWIYSSLSRNTGSRINGGGRVIFKIGAQSLDPKIKKTEVKVNPAFSDRLEKQLNYKYKYRAISRIPVKITASEMSKENRNFDFKKPKFDNDLTAAQRGTANHLFLQCADFERAEKDITGEIDRLLKKEFITKNQAEVLNIKSLKLFFKSELYKRMTKANKIYREESFLCEYPANELYKDAKDETVLVQGIADCVFEEDGELVIVDYKTDRKGEKSLVRNYKEQLKIYKKAISKVKNKTVKECYLYSLYLNKEIKC